MEHQQPRSDLHRRVHLHSPGQVQFRWTRNILDIGGSNLLWKSHLERWVSNDLFEHLCWR